MKRSLSPAAFTLIEASVALAVAGVAIAGIMMLNSAALRLVRSSRMSNAASLVIQERVEQMRITNWKNVTDATYISGTYFGSTPDSVEPLGDVTETLTLSAYPDETVTEKLQVTKSPNGVQTITSGADIPDQSLVRVDYRLEWAGEGGRQRKREASTILSKVGVSTLNLAFAGGMPGDDLLPADSPSPTSDASATPGDSATPAPSASASPTPTDSGNGDPGNGNGNAYGYGRGNINGQPGTK